MKAYLMQHGKPVPKEIDSDRPLSDDGRNDVLKVAEHLKILNIKVGHIFHSGKTRARQTAEMISSVLFPHVVPHEKSGLAPLDDIKKIAGLIHDLQDNIFIAGHLPHLSRLCSFLVTGDDNLQLTNFQQGGILCLEKRKDESWGIAWMIIPEII